jgi:hypothetical protein
VDLNTKTEWPENAPPELGNPLLIEAFLKEEIRRTQITLIGELDLVAPTSYAGIEWSLFELASYLVNKNIIKNSLTVEKMADWKYPATLSIWSVGVAQLAADGMIKLWDLDGYSAGQLANLATMFSRSIEMLELATFEGELLGAQKNVQLARIHAMIPDFAAHRYSEIIRRAVKYNQGVIQILHAVIEDTVISKGVRRLFSARPEIGMDLIERSFNFLAYGYQLELPSRLKSKLDQNLPRENVKRKVDSFPVVEFVEWEGAFRVVGASSWQILDEALNRVEFNQIPESNVYVTKDGSLKIPILDISQGYLICNSSGRLVYGNSIPSDGYLLWHDETKIVSAIDFLEDGYMPFWKSWHFSYFQNVSELELVLPNGDIKKLTNRKTVSVQDFRVPNLLNESGNPVFSAYPTLIEPQLLKLTDHITDSQLELNQHIGPVVNESGGEIDLTISSGLGKSRRWTGLVIPGIQLSGLDNAIRVGDKKPVTLRLPKTWKFTYPADFVELSEATVNIEASTNLEPQVFRIRNSGFEEFFIGLEIPVLSWSIEFTNRESITVAGSFRVNRTERASVRAVILHGVGDYVPLLRVGEVSIPGRKRGNDVRYDLRLLADIRNNSNDAVEMTWNYETVRLVSFEQVASKKLKSVELSKLASAVIEKGYFSQADWDNYRSRAVKESLDLRKMLLRQRGNR